MVVAIELELIVLESNYELELNGDCELESNDCELESNDD